MTKEIVKCGLCRDTGSDPIDGGKKTCPLCYPELNASILHATSEQVKVRRPESKIPHKEGCSCEKRI